MFFYLAWNEPPCNIRAANPSISNYEMDDELPPLVAMYGADDGEAVRLDEGARELRVDVGNGVLLTATIPDGYPKAAPHVAIGAGAWPGDRASHEAALDALGAMAAERAQEGEPCLVELCMRVQELADDAAEAARADAGRGSDSQHVAADVWFAVVMLDHMNDRARYTRHISDMAGGLDACHVLMLAGAARPNGAVKAFVVVVGTDADLTRFVSELRTQMVDVNKAGKPCKERMATVLARRRRAPHGDDGRPPFGSVSCDVTGVHIELFEDESTLEAALDARNVLHCGSGDLRFE